MKSNFIAAALSAAALLICLHAGKDAVVHANSTPVKASRLSPGINIAQTEQGNKNCIPPILMHHHGFRWGEPGFVTTDPIDFIIMIP